MIVMDDLTPVKEYEEETRNACFGLLEFLEWVRYTYRGWNKHE
jgi:hypothetical protein